MNKLKYCMFLIISALTLGCTQGPDADIEQLSLSDGPRTTFLFDFDWKYHRGAVDGAEIAEFDDAGWRQLDLPHDWGVEDLPGTESPITEDAIGGIDAGYTLGGTAWYRKTFFVPAKMEGKSVRIQFEGVYMNADIWLNGEHLGNHPYGYTSFWYDIADKLQYGADNLISVEVKNEGENSRWYSGSGIYRHVWLTILDPVHITQWGTYITSKEITDKSAMVTVITTMNNQSDSPQEATLVTTILGPDGVEIAKHSVSQSVDAVSSVEFMAEFEVVSPNLWSIETPDLYTAVSEVFLGESAVDQYETNFGIRSIAFNIEQGFLLNGEPVLLKGGCVHHDNGPLGSATFDRAEERRVELMKASGYNAIRCAHNPPSPAFLDACDRLGVVVIDEAFDHWRDGKNPQDYNLYFDDCWQKDIESMVFRDRNHPSIIMWSIGNEIPGMETPEVVEVAQMLGDYVRELEPTRPVTSAVNGLNPKKDPYFATLDVKGYNYPVGGDHWENSLYEKDHERVPDRIMYCAESYPLESFGSWMSVKKFPYVFGDFVWTGFDYLGEASIGWMGYPQEGSFYPWLHAFCGDIDICGFKRPQSYYRDVLWMENQVSIFVHPPVPSFEMTNPDLRDWSKWNWLDVVADWNWPDHEGEVLKVNVYSSCPEVELFLDGESMGKKSSSMENEFTPTWDIPWQQGELKAVGYTDGQQATVAELETAAEPVEIILTADHSELKADGQDLSYVVVELVDEEGVRNPKSQNLIEFEIEGPGTIAAVGSSNPFGLESFRLPKRQAYQGRCLVIVKAAREPGEIILTASSEGLIPAKMSIVVE
ncbi:MAG: DUF4982 domain-containing protein [Bacteroidales bacterium]|nr:DUF4982 domain-containing protein [Bacteroidales bacterium]